MPTLIARSGPLAGRRFELDDDEVVLGREDATITLSDEETSRRHAAIRVTAGVVVIEDLGSTNGTFVDGKRIDVATELNGGETIKLGQTVFDIEVEVAEPQAPPVDAGATRMAARPEPIADPDRTAVSHTPPPPEAAPPAPPAPPVPEPVAAEPDPDRTAVRPRPPEAAPPEPIADPDRTAVRPRPPAPEAAPPPPPPPPAPPAPPAAAPIADPDRTALRPRPGREPGREPAPAAAAASAPPPAPPAAPKPRAPARPARGVAPAEEQPFGAFAPPAGRKRGGIATRKLAPSLVSFATIITTAVALVVYFIGR